MAVTRTFVSEIAKGVPKEPAVYSIMNIYTGQEYIGTTNNLYTRWRKHLNTMVAGTHSNKYLQEDFYKYGLRAFHLYALCDERDEVLECIEIKLSENCYNSVGRPGRARCRFSHEDHEGMFQMKDAGWSLGEIADAYDTTKPYVCRILKGNQSRYAKIMSKLYDDKGVLHADKAERVLVCST